ncbi:transmembrane sensor [Rubrivivax gelatinosus]|nr:transmembrane sensor [Rubrivivax gelatinosus]
MAEPGVALDAAQRAALQWQVCFWSGEAGEAEQRAFEAWLAADEAHRRAWERLQRAGGRLQALPGGVAGTVLRATAGGGRRRALRALLLLAGAGGAASLVRETPAWQLARADERTATGERRDLLLPDGSRATLNTASALDLRFDASQRLARLLAGEVFITTAADAAHRPFVVETPAGRVQALGTRFALRCLDAATRVQVFEGAVELRPRDGGVARRLDAGGQLSFDATAVGAPEPLDEAATAWMRGLLVAERMRLDDFVAELSRYRRGVLRCAPTVAGLRVSGVFPLADTDAVLRSLVRALPLRITRATRWWLNVEPAGGRA